MTTTLVQITDNVWVNPDAVLALQSVATVPGEDVPPQTVIMLGAALVAGGPDHIYVPLAIDDVVAKLRVIFDAPAELG